MPLRTSLIGSMVALTLALGCRTSVSSRTRSSFPRVDADLSKFDEDIRKRRAAYLEPPANPHSYEADEARLAFAVELDQLARNYTATPEEHGYDQGEREYFEKGMTQRTTDIDGKNRHTLKKILELKAFADWFPIGKFGPKLGEAAWLLVQHADEDLPLQKAVLAKLERLLARHEANPKHYAYLYDRVAVNERRLQRYGTQGGCVGPGQWKARDTEAPAQVDQLRKSVGLDPLGIYEQMGAGFCR
jgi:hypothetical protein